MTHIDLIAQLRVQVYDDANPAERAETRVIINVQRNVNAPVFKQATYEATIVENYPIGGSVLQVGLAMCVVHAFIVMIKYQRPNHEPTTRCTDTSPNGACDAIVRACIIPVSASKESYTASGASR